MMGSTNPTLKITCVSGEGIVERHIDKDALEPTALDGYLTIVNKFTGEILVQLKPGGFMDVREVKENA